MLPGAAARRSERVLEHELQGQILNFCAAEARAADAVFYLSHLIQLPCLRLGQRGPVAELIASRLLGVPPRLCVCAASSSSSELRAEASFLVDLLVVPTPTPALDPIRLPGIDVTGGLLPPANPLPRDLLVLWAEAGVLWAEAGVAGRRCLLLPSASRSAGSQRAPHQCCLAQPSGRGLASCRLPREPRGHFFVGAGLPPSRLVCPVSRSKTSRRLPVPVDSSRASSSRLLHVSQTLTGSARLGH